jgi:hypothetical protein
MRFTSVVSCFPFIRISYTTTTHIFLYFFLQYLFVSHLVFVYIPHYIVWYIVLFVLGLCVSFYFMYIWGVIQYLATPIHFFFGLVLKSIFLGTITAPTK